MQAVVDARLALRLALPRLDGLGQRAVEVLEREVDEHRRAAGERGRGAGVPVVGGDRAAERHVHVRVPVDEARHQLRAGDVDDLGAVARQVDADRRDRLVLDGHVGAEEPSAVTTVPPASTMSLMRLNLVAPARAARSRVTNAGGRLRAPAGADQPNEARRVRDVGSMPCAVRYGRRADAGGSWAVAKPGTDGIDLVATVTCREPYRVGDDPSRVVAYDFGIKTTILRHLATIANGRGWCPLPRAPPDVLARQPDGVFLSTVPAIPRP